MTVAVRYHSGMPVIPLRRLLIHDLRHSAASEMINNEADLYTVGTVLGHKSGQNTKRYAHLATASLRSAIGSIGQKIPGTKKCGPRKSTRTHMGTGGPPVSRTRHQQIISPSNRLFPDVDRRMLYYRLNAAGLFIGVGSSILL
jgi:hypothetical protein